jgi:hypothetical protein
MPLQLQLDNIDGSAEAFGITTSWTRTGWVTGFTTDPSLNPENTLMEVLKRFRDGTAGFPQIMVSTTPVSGGQSGILNRILVNGASHDAARVTLVYEPFAPLVASALYIRIAGSLQNYQTNQIPGQGKALKIEGSFRFTRDGQEKRVRIPEDYVTVNVFRPLIRVEITQVKQGTPATGALLEAAESVGMVNGAPWFNRPAGHWLVGENDVQISRYQGYHTRRAWVMAKGSYRTGTTNDWSEYAVLRSQQTGRFAKVEDATWNAAKSRPYGFGWIYPSETEWAATQPFPSNAAPIQGLIRAGMYPTINLEPFFGNVFESNGNYFQLDRTRGPQG